MINLHFGKNYREVNPEEQGMSGRKPKPERKHRFQKTKKGRTSRARNCSGVVACEFLLVYD